MKGSRGISMPTIGTPGTTVGPATVWTPQTGHTLSPSALLLQQDHGPTAGVILLTAFVLLTYSRASDLFLPGLYLPFLTSLAALCALILSGRVLQPLGSVGGRWLIGLTVWMLLSIPFSVWKGGSVDFIRTVWFKSFMVFVLVGGIPRSMRDCRRLAGALGLAGLLVVLFAGIWGVRDAEGRLSLDAGVLENPNELGMLVLLLAPFGWLVAHEAPRWSLRKLVGWLAVAGTIPVIVATGSRGTFLAMVAMLVAVLAFQQWSRRILVATLALMAAGVATVLTPETTLQRYATIFSGPDSQGVGQRETSVAESSAEARFRLFEQSVRLTFMNPVLGVGPGQFQVAERDLASDSGERAAWHETHNSYTQVSSETGIPGLVFFLGALFIPMNRVRRLCRSSTAALSGPSLLLARTVFLSFVGFAVGAFFNSVAYSMYVTTFVGLAEAVLRTAEVPVVGTSPAPVAGLTSASTVRPVVKAV
ncbi:MAG: O-antigen ligase family protein [Vicinamibacterales bacterium]